ncbi:hypothetical protein PFISCL1PPCAC_26037 [Pristionchus fissidentatus]|uniref:Ribosomal protein n=1 Tax=Pristionchus fissidentatus TaxID=1538716 RepID=A0AAV5WVX5_9BILA|nr:hypothetical protein PFISCL1PPCAC_26037 [Pristionchus fissidentatus]
MVNEGKILLKYFGSRNNRLLKVSGTECYSECSPSGNTMCLGIISREQIRIGTAGTVAGYGRTRAISRYSHRGIVSNDHR